MRRKLHPHCVIYTRGEIQNRCRFWTDLRGKREMCLSWTCLASSPQKCFLRRGLHTVMYHLSEFLIFHATWHGYGEDMSYHTVEESVLWMGIYMEIVDIMWDLWFYSGLEKYHFLDLFTILDTDLPRSGVMYVDLHVTLTTCLFGVKWESLVYTPPSLHQRLSWRR